MVKLAHLARDVAVDEPEEACELLTVVGGDQKVRMVGQVGEGVEADARIQGLCARVHTGADELIE